MSMTIDRLRELIGDELTLALVKARAGNRLYVPRERHANSLLADIVGVDAAAKIADEYGGESWMVPIAREFRVEAYSRQGMPVPEIARRVGCHADTVFKIRRKLHLSRAQLDLFKSEAG